MHEIRLKNYTGELNTSGYPAFDILSLKLCNLNVVALSNSTNDYDENFDGFLENNGSISKTDADSKLLTNESFIIFSIDSYLTDLFISIDGFQEDATSTLSLDSVKILDLASITKDICMKLWRLL